MDESETHKANETSQAAQKQTETEPNTTTGENLSQGLIHEICNCNQEWGLDYNSTGLCNHLFKPE
jgi:hypothetical protein